MTDSVALQTRRITVTKYEPGAWVNGKFEKGEPSVSSFYASVQPVSGNELLQLPEGQRNREVVKIYACDTGFRVANATSLEPGDTIEIDDIPFQVQNVFRWAIPDSPLAHWKAVAVKAGDRGDTPA